MAATSRDRLLGWVACVFLLCAPAAAQPAHADEELFAAMFNDHAVLQRDRPIRIWGARAPASA